MINIDFILDLINNNDIRALTVSVLCLLPDYWHNVAASSSGKYHPAFSLGEGGLVRHSIVVAYFASRLADAWNMTSDERDLAIAAGLVHDGMKQGLDAGHTVHEHPVLMANFLREKFVGNEYANTMAHMIESHMGKWTTSKYSDVVLPEPTTKLQLLLQAADMLAATKEISFDFGEEV